jgi:GDP-D-mannose 3',5'-epimerase
VKNIVVLGAGGFIGNAMVSHLRKQGHWVRGVDLKSPEFSLTEADEFVKGDLTDYNFCDSVISTFVDEVYQFAADMGGADYIFTEEHDADIMSNSARINLNVLDVMKRKSIKKVFYSSSACIYPNERQNKKGSPALKEEFAYPANPDSEYGWEKLFSERLYLAYKKNHGFDVKIARFHNIYGPGGVFDGGKEKAPAAMCRKAIESDGTMEVYGDGKQRRSFLYIDDCINGVSKLMDSELSGPYNIGSEEDVSINELAKLAIKFSGKETKIKNIDVKQIGVRTRNSENSLVEKDLNWKPKYTLEEGLKNTFEWIRYNHDTEHSDIYDNKGSLEWWNK